MMRAVVRGSLLLAAAVGAVSVAIYAQQQPQLGIAAVTLTAGPYVFGAVMEEERAPETCAAFNRLLPFNQRIIHSRWSGEAWSVVRVEFMRALALCSEFRRAGWFIN